MKQISELASLLREKISGDLPGMEKQWEMASSDRRIEGYPRHRRDDTIAAAVMILLYPSKGKIHTIFIQRPVYKGAHSGQISFPGGKAEKEDTGPVATALRESCEETGTCSGDIHIIGTLTPLYIHVSNIEVTPVVAWSVSRPEFRINKAEVTSIIEAELGPFTLDSSIREREMDINGEPLNVKYFDYQGKVIWGATAMILNELLAIIKETGITFEE